MRKTIIVSNRLPLQIKRDKKEIQITPSVGGLATGMKSVHRGGNGLWVGWTGLTEEEMTPDIVEEVHRTVANENCAAVSLSQSDIDYFYLGFSNRVLWPLFHYFMEYTEFDKRYWESYKAVNKKYAKVVLEHINDGDLVWIHDYQLLLLPKLIKEKKPTASVGFFLHIPFPSYEIFRSFPWREELLLGMLGADLIGFHTYDYERHFLSSIKRILRLDVHFNEITYQERIVKVDSFPMGIDYDKFYKQARIHEAQKPNEQSQLRRRINDHLQSSKGSQLILSIDRLDYIKGIPNRLRAFELFLTKYPQYKERVRLIMLVVPSRSKVPQYQRLKKETDELVGRINGEFSTVNWTPIWYFYRAMPFKDLIDLYISSDVALITPVRDGMNLVAKEYIATRTRKDGVLILSEMTGAAKEMNEAIIINPNNHEQIANAIKKALELSLDEQISNNTFLQKRLKRYSVKKWAFEFIKSLEDTKQIEKVIVAKKIDQNITDYILKQFHEATKKLILLDYDGTLTNFKDNPQDATPDEALFRILDNIHHLKKTQLVIISGRDQTTLKKWFEHKGYSLISDHGVWIKINNQDWKRLERPQNSWMKNVKPILETYTDRTPGTFIEEKKYSLVWHFRKADPELAEIRVADLDTVLMSLIANDNLQMLKGNKVIEIKSSNVNKGRAASKLMKDQYDFIMAIGDDYTDEYMFEEIPDHAHTIKVGFQKTKAKYYIKNSEEVRELLNSLAKQNKIIS